MRQRVARFALVVALLAMFSCGTLPRRGVSADQQSIANLLNNTVLDSQSDQLPQRDSFPPDDYPESARTLWHYVEGLKAYRLWEDSTLARHHFESALAIDSNYAPAAYHTAAMLTTDYAAEAEPYSLRAYRTDTTDGWFLAQLGQLKILQDKYDEAIPIYVKMLRTPRGHEPENHRVLAMLYNENDQPFSAIITLDSAEVRFGIHEAISPLKRHLLIKTGQYDRAIEQSEELIAADPYNIDNYIITAEICVEANKDSLALVNFHRALALDSTSVAALGSLNEFYGRRGDHPNYLRTMVPLMASKEVDLARKIKIFNNLTTSVDYYQKYYSQINTLAMTIAVTHPDDYEAMELYTSHLITTGDMDRALEIYKSHVNDSLPRVEVFNTILDIESFKERPDSVAYYTQLAMKRLQNHPEFLLRRGTYHLVNDQFKEAEQALKAALRMIDSDSLRGATLGLIGDVQYQLNRPRKAFRNYDKALRLLPNDAGILNNYAYFLSESGGDLERALEMSTRSIELDRGNSSNLDTHAWILYRLGRYDEAKRFMRQAITLDPSQSAVLMCHYGDILYALGERFMAQVYWEKARDAGYEESQIEERLQKLKKP